eukprot:gene41834-65991_t
MFTRRDINRLGLAALLAAARSAHGALVNAMEAMVERHQYRQLCALLDQSASEDTPASLMLLSDMLKRAGHTVREAPNGELALWSAQARPPELILLDVRMPGIDGYEACRRPKRIAKLRD